MIPSPSGFFKQKRTKTHRGSQPSGHWCIRISPAVTGAEPGQSSDLPLVFSRFSRGDVMDMSRHGILVSLSGESFGFHGCQSSHDAQMIFFLDFFDDLRNFPTHWKAQKLKRLI